MAIHDRLPRALRDAAGPLPGDVGSWAELRARGQQVRRRRTGRAGVALATVVALAVGAVVVTRAGNEEPSVMTTKGGRPEVVATRGGRVVVLDPSDGHVVRTLDVAADDVAAAVTATPDGRTVYFQRGEQCGRTPEIWRVPSAGGKAERVAATGEAPLVSPDGRWLAFAGTANAAPGDCGPFDRLVVMSLEPLNLTPDFSVTSSLDFTPTGSVLPVAWSPASDALVVTGNEFSDGTRNKTVGVSPAGELTDLGATASPSGNGYAFLPNGEAITAFPRSTTSRVATFDPSTGDEGRVITEVEKPLSLIAADQSGRSFLMEGPLADTPDGHDLYRVNVGDPRPVKLASRVRAARFLPRALPSAASDEILARVDGGLVVLSSLTGRVVRSVSTDPVLQNFGTVSAPATGDVAYVTIGVPDRPTPTCSSDIGQSPAVAKVDLATGAATPLFQAATYPVVSADGGWLAYGAGQGCNAGNEQPTLGITNVASPANYRPFEQDVPFGPIVPLAWSRDGSTLVSFVSHPPHQQEPDAVVLDQIPFDDHPQPVNVPGALLAGAYLPDGRLVGAYADKGARPSDTTYHVAAIDRHGRPGAELFRTTSRFPIAQLSSDPTGRLVMISPNGGLAVWAPGDHAVTILLAAGGPIEVQGAAWLPAP